MKTTNERIKLLLEDKRLLSEQVGLMERWVKHMKTYKGDGGIIDLLYTIREFAIFIKKGFDKATMEDIGNYLDHKFISKESITGSRLLDVKEKSTRAYHYRIKNFYRWVLKHTDITIDKELAYPKPKIVRKEEKSMEEKCERRAQWLLQNKIMRDVSNKEELMLDENNLGLLKDYHNYKITSGKVESYAGFISKLYFLKRLGLHLKKKNKNYKIAKREDIQDFLNEVQESIRINATRNGRFNGKLKVDGTYKAYLLDFYRFIYGMFGEEQPRNYPEVVSWLYQKRKKSHDKTQKEIIPSKEIKLIIEKCSELRDKALIALISDCSARVGEIVNTNIGDLRINEISTDAKYKHLIATITLRGKTGERTNQLFYSVPYLRLWLLNHPLKDNPNAPLFIATKESRYGQRLTAVGINKILQRASKKAEIKRHIHAHLFRHTNLTKMAKILSESELKIHAGWGSDSKMASVYVHLDEKDVANKILLNYGLVNKEEIKDESVLEIHICPNTICSYQNPNEAKFCLKCGYPLSLKTAISLTKIKEKEEELHKEILNRNISNESLSGATDIKEVMYNILKKDPELIRRLKELVGLTEAIN